MRQKDQKMRFNDAELQTLKNVFADNDDLLFAVRKVFLQGTLSKEENEAIKTQITEPVYDIIKKFFLPEIDVDAPLFQVTDMPMTLSLDMKTKGEEEMQSLFRAKKLEIDYLEQQLRDLKEVGSDTGSSKPIKLSEMASFSVPYSEYFVNITARNYLLSWIDSNIQQIKFLAGKKEETVEETVKRLQKDSSK